MIPGFCRRSALLVGAACVSLIGVSSPRAACPSGTTATITSGTGGAGIPLVFSFAPGAIAGSFFVLGDGDDNNSGTLPSSEWLLPLGDLNHDGRIEYRINAPGQGAGGWGDPRTIGCPGGGGFDLPPLVVILNQPREDLDGDGVFDIFEDINHNHFLDPGEDRDRDGRLTPSGTGCGGFAREDVD